MIVDNLKSCYSTQALVRLAPPLTATIRWYWAPPGARPLPTETAFGSSVWETGESDRVYPQPGLGEISLVRTWDKGDAPPGVTGQATPTPLSWYVDGVPAGVAGGLAPCPGSLPARPVIWLRPEELVGQLAGAPLLVWPPAPGTGIGGWHKAFGIATVVQDALSGFLGAQLTNASLGYPPSASTAVISLRAYLGGASKYAGGTLAIVGDYTAYVVWRAVTFGDPVVGDVTNQLFGISDGIVAGSGMQPGLVGLASGFIAADQVLHVVATIRAGSSGRVRVDGADLVDGTVSSGSWSCAALLAGSKSIISAPQQIWVPEVIVWPRGLAAAELAAVDVYFATKYATIPILDTTDMLIGQIIWDAGADAVPPKCLLCDGSAVSRSTFSLLFGRLGTTYGAGDGLTTFNLPNIVGKIIYGAGGVYHAGQAVGADGPTLTPNQLPAHTHPVTDPGHAHTPNTLNLAPLVWNPAGAEGAGAGTDRETVQGGLTGSAVTGVTVGSNVTTGSPLDVRQAGVALRPLIFAGV